MIHLSSLLVHSIINNLFFTIHDKPLAHPYLSDVSMPLFEIYDDVKMSCWLHLEYDNQSKCEAITSRPSSSIRNHFSMPSGNMLIMYVTNLRR